ncbi:hypothetical protein [Marinobacter subterrani]|uniref:hypothetical protein n=1 Tax=Marinobacter subterrani TaxID=1658765 RepID=UPI0023561755|nr:hypothetical protein [Marinobacter subterrani]
MRTKAPIQKAVTAEDRRKIFVENYAELAETYAPLELGQLYGLGRQMRSDLDRKLRDPSLPSHRGTTQADALLIQMLVFLKREGYDLAKFEFNERGEIVEAPRRKE